MEALRIVRYSGQRPPDLRRLRDASLAEGHGLVARTLDDWASGANRFDRTGEAFFLATGRAMTIGMCGLNVDPFVHDPRIGRIRHLYVLPAFRRRRTGRRLVEACLAEADGVFERIRLRTFDPVAARFYEAAGFLPLDGGSATHTLDLEIRPNGPR